jgi:hypothetical protein
VKCDFHRRTVPPAVALESRAAPETRKMAQPSFSRTPDPVPVSREALWRRRLLGEVTTAYVVSAGITGGKEHVPIFFNLERSLALA